MEKFRVKYIYNGLTKSQDFINKQKAMSFAMLLEKNNNVVDIRLEKLISIYGL